MQDINPSRAVVGRMCKDCNAFIVGSKYVTHNCSNISTKTCNIRPKSPTLLPMNQLSSNSTYFNWREIDHLINEPIEPPEPVEPIELDKDDTASSITSQLILEVEKRRPLWDHRLPKVQRYPNVINKLWEEIVQELNCTFSAKELEKKFVYLKDQYRRMKSKENNKASGSKGGKPQKPWKHFNSLVFLDDVILIKNKTVSSIGDIDPVVAVADLKTENIKSSINGKFCIIITLIIIFITPIIVYCNVVYFLEKIMGPTDQKSASNIKFEEALIEELKATRPTSPIPLQVSSDTIFCNYLVDLMSELPNNKKRKLQGVLVQTILKEIDN